MVTGYLERSIEQGVAIGNARLEAEFVLGLAEPPRVGELEPDHQIAGIAVSLLVSLYQRLAQGGQAGFVRFVDDELVWVGATVRPHRHRLAAEDEFRPALPKPPPAPQHVFGDAPFGGAVPAFHGLNHTTVAKALAVDDDLFHRPRQR